MRQISAVIELIRRRVGHKDVKSAFSKKLEFQFRNSLPHLPFRILIGSLVVTHRTAQPQNPHTLMDVYLIFYTNTAVRRNLFVYFVVISPDIQNRSRGKSCQKRKVIGIQIAAGYNQVDSLKLTFIKKFPQIFLFFIWNRKYLHS